VERGEQLQYVGSNIFGIFPRIFVATQAARFSRFNAAVAVRMVGAGAMLAVLVYLYIKRLEQAKASVS
jgi:hypothetical protein